MSDGATNGKGNGHAGDEMAASAKEGQGPGTGPLLTTRQGQPVYDNQDNRTVGERGLTVLLSAIGGGESALFGVVMLRHIC